MLRRTSIGAMFALLWLVPLPAHAFSTTLDDIQNTLAGRSSTTERVDAFRDVPSSAWFAEAVTTLHTIGVISGTSEAGLPTGTFEPQRPVTRAEMLKMAVEAAGGTADCPEQPRAQAARNHWAAAYVACAEAQGFRLLSQPPLHLDHPIRRSAALVLIHDAFGDTVPPLFAHFDDTEGHFYEADVAFATIEGIVSGDTNAQGEPTNRFRPNAPLNRAEAAKILYEKLLMEETQEALPQQTSSAQPQPSLPSSPQPTSQPQSEPPLAPAFPPALQPDPTPRALPSSPQSQPQPEPQPQQTQSEPPQPRTTRSSRRSGVGATPEPQPSSPLSSPGPTPPPPPPPPLPGL